MNSEGPELGMEHQEYDKENQSLVGRMLALRVEILYDLHLQYGSFIAAFDAKLRSEMNSESMYQRCHTIH